ncbi:putative transposase [Shigella flexneri VA-6]|nr:putative transposase [Shigella flexneri VA-6]
MNNELPDDIELLKAMLRKQQSRFRQYACQVAGYEQEIERLKAQLDRLRRMLFGQSSEKKRHKLENQIRQAEKRLSELENRLNTARNLLEDASSVTDSPDTSPPSENPIASKPEFPGRKSSRKPLPAELPRETHRLLPAETSCPACGGVLKEMGETISEQLDIINTAFKVVETIRPNWPVAGVMSSFRHHFLLNRSSAVMPVQGYLHGSWSANIWNISLYIASQKYTRDRAWS